MHSRLARLGLLNARYCCDPSGECQCELQRGRPASRLTMDTRATTSLYVGRGGLCRTKDAGTASWRTFSLLHLLPLPRLPQPRRSPHEDVLHDYARGLEPFAEVY